MSKSAIYYYHKRYFVSKDDVNIVLNRLPDEVKSRLKGVHFEDGRYARRAVGYVWRGGHEIHLCKLGTHCSLTSPALRYSSGPEAFGALRGSQWPVLAIRRYLLYDVLLHELGHLQIIHPRNNDDRRKFAREPRAMEFAHHWRRKLWAETFAHPDPAHAPPPPEELSATKAHWPQAHADHKQGLQRLREGDVAAAFDYFTRAVESYPYHVMALEQLGMVCWQKSADDSKEKAVGYFRRALALDPNLIYAPYYLLSWKSELRQRERQRIRNETQLTACTNQ